MTWPAPMSRKVRYQICKKIRFAFVQTLDGTNAWLSITIKRVDSIKTQLASITAQISGLTVQLSFVNVNITNINQ